MHREIISDEEAISSCRSEKEWLNDYHRECYEKLSPFMTDEENEWLREYTRAI